MTPTFLRPGSTYGEQIKSLEAAVQDFWKSGDINKAKETPLREKFYVLGMFPYPSGNAHLGHALVYSATDAISRLARLQGKDVLHPIGWDAFGLPAENAAINNNIHPSLWTEKNIQTMRDEQIGMMGFSFSPDREINTSSPDYYRWSQWLFLKLHEHGLVYRSKEMVNWDPVDQTVLANEQVIDGKGWRSGVAIERRLMDQWYVRITDYAEALHTELDNLPGWSDAAKGAQRNWIGRMEGVDINLKLTDTKQMITTFTTEPELIHNATAVLLAPELEQQLDISVPDKRAAVKAFCAQTLLQSEVARVANLEKTGIFTGRFVEHPLTGAQLPVYVASYITPASGSGASLCVPSHSAADQALMQSIGEAQPGFDSPAHNTSTTTINSGPYAGLEAAVARKAIVADLFACGQATSAVRYRLRDWAIGRQRFWGAPIPMEHNASGEWRPVMLENLPIRLPENVDFKATNGRSPLSQDPDFYTVRDNNGKDTGWRRETDTMDTFMCSAWYVWRFLDPKNSSQAWDPSRANAWMPIDAYVGGLEHANQHLIYLRFMSHFLNSIGLTPTSEPILNFIDNGLVQLGGNKMSKSRGNVVRPDEMIAKHGADALHMYILSNGPINRDFEWDEAGLVHKRTFLSRVFNLYRDSDLPAGPITLAPSKVTEQWSRLMLRNIGQVIEGVESEVGKNHQFHVAIAKTHEGANHLFAAHKELTTPERQHVFAFAMQCYLPVLGLTAPHLAEAIWRDKVSPQQSLFSTAWPVIDPAVYREDHQQVSVPFMINGRKRGELLLTQQQDDSLVLAELTQLPNDALLHAVFNGKAMMKPIIVRDKATQKIKLLNFPNR